MKTGKTRTMGLRQEEGRWAAPLRGLPGALPKCDPPVETRGLHFYNRSRWWQREGSVDVIELSGQLALGDSTVGLDWVGVWPSV